MTDILQQNGLTVSLHEGQKLSTFRYTLRNVKHLECGHKRKVMCLFVMLNQPPFPLLGSMSLAPQPADQGKAQSPSHLQLWALKHVMFHGAFVENMSYVRDLKSTTKLIWKVLRNIQGCNMLINQQRYFQCLPSVRNSNLSCDPSSEKLKETQSLELL
jgi:hypothetical protein